MSNPTPYPVPPPLPPMPPLPPRRYRRSFAGPLVLIILGIVFLLGNLHMLSWARLGTLFAHYWPALLILWGVVKVIEYQQAQREGVSARGIGAGGIFLVILIVVSGLIATGVAPHLGELRENLNFDDNDLENLFHDSYNFDDHLEQDLPASANSLRVNDDHGAVRVSVADDNKITVAVRKRVGAENQGDADKYNSETKPTITTVGGQLTLDAKTQGAGNHPVQTDLDIAIPRKMELHITSRRGDVSVTGRDGDVEINSQHGDVSVEEVTGNLKLNLEKSSAKIEQITGDVHINGRLNEVAVTDVKGAAQLEGEFGESVKLSRITKNVNFKSSRTDLEFSRIDGDLELDSDDLHADQITGPVRLTTRSKQIRLEDVSGDVRLQNENGGVDVTMRSLGNVQIDNRSGDIALSLPEKAGFHLDAHTRDGQIESDFSELKVDSDDRQAKASGTVGNGASHIVLNNDHDSIEIHRYSAKAMAPPAVPAVPAKPARSLPRPKEKVEPTDH